MKWRASNGKGKSYEYAPRLPNYNQMNAFTMQGTALYYQDYKNRLKERKEPIVVTADDIRKGINSAKEQKEWQSSDEHLYALLQDDIDISRNIVAIYGCYSDPWYACIALAHGAKGVVIITTQDMVIEDDRIIVAKPDEVKEGFADYAMSICTLQDEGLGAYDGVMEPDADLAAMRVIRKILKENGKLFLSLPCGRDMLVWNKRRIYGKRRLKLLMEDWSLKGTIGWDAKEAKALTHYADFTPLFVLEKQ